MASYQQYRAPAADDTALVEPPWPVLSERLKTRAEGADVSIGDRPLSTLRSDARSELITAAVAWTRRYTDAAGDPIGTLAAGAPLIVSGHQPELFHPGVWFKNFALDALAKQTGGVGVHLLIDSDLCREPSVRTPTGSIDSPRSEAIAYDRPRAAVPHEERALADAATFATFDQRVGEAIRPFVADPLVTRLWRHADAARRRTDNLGAILSEARHRLELEAGSRTLEAPISAVADTAPFRRLAAELLTRATDARSAYNAALADYRKAHRISSPAQPLPDLATDGDWCESPLWVWSTADPTRRGLFVRVRDDAVELTDRYGWSVKGPRDADGLVGWLAELRGRGVKLRSRALVTTLFGRLVLSDLFLHGIGGAKYDQVTDRFAERLLGIVPPPHATLSATLRLPIEHARVTPADRQAARRRLRDLRYHPERDLPDHPATQEKRRWVNTPKTPDNAAERHAAINAANARLRGELGEARAVAERRLAEVERGLKASAILDSREHAFCLFPERDVVDRLRSLCPDGRSTA